MRHATIVLAMVLLPGCFWLQKGDIELTVRAGLGGVRQARSELAEADMTGPVAKIDRSLYAAERYLTTAVRAIGPTKREDEIPFAIPEVADDRCAIIDARTQKLDDLGAKISGGIMEKLGYAGGGLGILSAFGAAGLFYKRNKAKIKSLANLYMNSEDRNLAKIGDEKELEAAKHRLSQRNKAAKVEDAIQAALKEKTNGV